MIKDFIKAIILIPLFILFFIPIFAHADYIEQTGTTLDYNGSTGNDEVYQPIGNGFDGYLTRVKIINQVNSSSTVTIVGCSTTATSTAFSGCDTSGHRVQVISMKVTDDRTITSLGGGWYLHDFSTTTPTMVMNTAYYYNVNDMLDTQGIASTVFFQNCFTGSGSVTPGVCNSVNSIYLYLETTGQVGIILDNTETRILSETPATGSTIATSTTNTIGATGYLSIDDFTEDYNELRIHIENSAKSYENCTIAFCSQLDNGAVSRDFTYPLVVYGYFNYSSTTAGLPIGKYYMTTSITKGSFCLFGFCATTSEIVSTTTIFIMATTTKADAIKDAVIAHINGLSGSSDNFVSCAIATFNLLTCGADLIDYAFVPTSDALSYTYNRINTEILVKPPFGYVTRFISILSTSTITALPSTTIPILMGSNVPGQMSVGTTSLFQADEILEGAGETLDGVTDPLSGNSIRDILEPMLQVIIWVAAFVTVIMDILGSHKHRQTL